LGGVESDIWVLGSHFWGQAGEEMVSYLGETGERHGDQGNIWNSTGVREGSVGRYLRVETDGCKIYLSWRMELWRCGA
jgi:hypothetical protein